MRVYWYWPFAREEDIGLAPEILRPGDHLTVEVIDRAGSPAVGDRTGWRVAAGLPEVKPLKARSPAWVADRAVNYTRRAAARRASMRAGGYDLCHLMYLNYFTDAIDPTLRRRRIPVVASVHDITPHTARLPPVLQHWALGRQYGMADQLVVHHEWMRQELLERFRIPPERVSVVAHFVSDVGVVAERDPARPHTVLFFGTFRENKGIETLLEAIALHGPPDGCRFRFAGRGSPRLERLVAEAAARDDRIVAEIGWQDARRKDALYREATLVVLPYASFTSQSGVLHESYGHRVPVVATDVGVLGRTVQEDGTGWVVPPNDPVRLQEAIERGLTDEEDRRVKRDATDRVARERSPERIGTVLRQLYDDVLARRRS